MKQDEKLEKIESMRLASPYDYQEFAPAFRNKVEDLKETGVSLNVLARSMGKNRANISHLTEEGSNPTLKTFCELCNALGLYADEILNYYRNDDEALLLEKFRNLGDDSKQLVLNFIDLL